MEFRVQRADVVTVYRAAIFPFPLEQVFQTFPEDGWIVPDWEPNDEGFRMSGPPTRGRVRFDFSVDRRMWAVRSDVMEETIEAYHLVEGRLRSSFPLPPAVEIDFVETRFRGSARTGNNPSESLARYWKRMGGSDTRPFLPISLPDLDGPLAPYGIRLAPSGLDANRRAWGEVTIAPQGGTGSSQYLFDLIYRHSEPERTLGVAHEALASITRSIESIEQ